MSSVDTSIKYNRVRKLLKFIFGRPASGKTYQILEKIKRQTKAGRQCVLIVPEQFSFESERAVLRVLGDKAALGVTVTSFTRLCDEVGRYAGGIAGVTLTDAQKVIFMSRALRSVEAELTLWRKYCRSVSFAKTMLDTVGEFKINAVSPDKLKAAAEETESAALKAKLCDTALIYETYDALVGERFLDPADRLTKLYRQLEDFRYFEKKDVFIDSFKGFTGQQFALIDRVLSQADNLTAALTDAPETGGEFGIFSNIRAAAEKIRYAAARYRISEEEPLVLGKPISVSANIAAVERLISGGTPEKTENDGSLTVCAADTAAEEAEFAVRNIRRLVRTENYRYRDFVIIARDAERYDDFINAACETYGVPCFSDKRRPLSAFPLAALADAAIQAILKGDSESILRFHKTGLGTLNTAEISELENYVTLWNIEGDMWRHEWIMDVRGFVSDDTEPDEKALGEINKLRKRAISPLEKLRAEFGGTAEDMAAALVRLFEECGAAEKLSAMSQKFLNDSEEFSSDVLRQSYDRYMKLLDGIAACFGTREVGKQEFREVLSLAVSFETVGSVPRYLDEVTFGAADRIRPSRPKVAFILGANQGVFPKEISASGIFGISDRKSLIALGVDIPDKSVSAATDENYLVYCNLCCPSDKLFISYARRSLTGENMEPSAFVQEITENIAHGFVAEPEEKITDENLPETAASAYSELCRRRNAENGGAAEIRAALAGTKELKKAEYTEKRLSGAPAAIGKETARQLFGEEIKMSASRLDTFNRCRFSFFCRYGLSVKKLQPAEFDVLQRGTVVHYCLERFVKEYGKGVSVLSPEKIEELTDGYINDYLDGVTGYRAVETARGRFLVSRISRSVKEVAKRLAEEFAQSGFEPIACELKIGGEGEKLEFPYDGGKISVSGSIDRVDKFGGYIRVVDYKTGSKKFKLPDILFGLNLQMLLYLYAAVRGAGLPDEDAAGILYMPSKRDTADKGMAMNGLIRKDEEIVAAMDREKQGDFVPKYAVTKSGELKKTCTSFISAEEFSEIFDFIERIMKRTGNTVASGDIAVSPVDGRETPACKYCDFASVCGREDEPCFRVPDLKNEEIFEKLKKGDEYGV